MSYLKQVIVLTKRQWELQEEINLLSRIQSAEKDEKDIAELHKKILECTSEIVETIHAIEVLKEVN